MGVKIFRVVCAESISLELLQLTEAIHHCSCETDLVRCWTLCIQLWVHLTYGGKEGVGNGETTLSVSLQEA